MPFYRHDEYLLAAVESVRAQTYSNWELIIVDDCSDGLPARDILGALADDTAKIAVIRHEVNQGAAGAKNTGIAAARGALIFPFDADDLLFSDYLDKTVGKLMSCQSDGVYTDFDIFGLQNAVTCTETYATRILSGWFPPNPVLMRKEVLDEAGGYDPDFDLGEDACLWISAHLLGKNFAHLHEPLYRYRRHPKSGTLMRGHDYPLIMTKLVRKFPRLYSENVVEIIDLLADHWIKDIYTHKSLLEEFQKKEAEYNHLHSEFHKLLAAVERGNETRVEAASIKQTIALLMNQIGFRLRSRRLKPGSQTE